MKEPRRAVEIEGKTVQEAVEKALKELKAKRSQVLIEILCEEEKGLFGMPGAKSAKVRVTLTKEQKNSLQIPREIDNKSIEKECSGWNIL